MYFTLGVKLVSVPLLSFLVEASSTGMSTLPVRTWSNSSLSSSVPSSTTSCDRCEVQAEAVGYMWSPGVSTFLGATVIVTVNIEHGTTTMTTSMMTGEPTGDLPSGWQDFVVIGPKSSAQHSGAMLTYPTSCFVYYGAYDMLGYATAGPGRTGCTSFTSHASTNLTYVQIATDEDLEGFGIWAKVPSDYLSLLGVGSCRGYADGVPTRLVAVSILTSTSITYVGGSPPEQPAHPTTEEANFSPLESAAHATTLARSAPKPGTPFPVSNQPPSLTTYDHVTSLEASTLTNSEAAISDTAAQSVGKATFSSEKSTFQAGDQTQIVVGKSTADLAAYVSHISSASAAAPSSWDIAVVPGAPSVTVSGSLTPLGVSRTVDGSSTAGVANINQISSAPSATPGSPFITITLAPSPSFASIGIGGSAITPNPASQYIVGSQTLAPGGVPVTVSGTLFSLASSASTLVIGAQTQNYVFATPRPPPLTIGGVTISANSASQYLVGTQTLVAGGSAITVSGTPFSLDSSGIALVVSSSTQKVEPSKGAPVLTIGGSTFTAGVGSRPEYLIGTQTLVAGGPAITISGTQFSLAPSATALIIGSSTQVLVSAKAAPILTIAGSTISAASGSGPAITVSGTPLSLALSASALIIGSSTQTLISSAVASLITIAGVTLTGNSASEYLVGGQTLSAGSAITVSGTRISLAPSASALVIGSSTRKLIPLEAASLITIAGVTLTSNSASEYLIGGQTLSPGSAITVSGTRISLAQGASQLVVGTSTQNLAKPTPTRPDLGPAILSGLGGTVGPTASGTVSGSVYAGGAGARAGQSMMLWSAMGTWIAAFLFG